MADTIIKTKTFGCICGYNQDFDPYADVQRHTRLFPSIPVGDCPSCATHPVTEQRKIQKMSLIIEPERMSTSTVASDETLATQEVTEVDSGGRVIMSQSGERQKLGIMDNKPAVITEPVFAPKMRPLTDEELAELKQQRDQNLDALESIAVKEVTDET